MKKPRRSQRLSDQNEQADEEPAHEDDRDDTEALNPITNGKAAARLHENANVAHLPSPVTRKDTTNTSTGAGSAQKTAESPPSHSRLGQPTPESSPPPFSQLHSPLDDTQPFSQFIAPAPYSYAVKDEEAEGVWGYLVSLRGLPGDQQTLVLKQRTACPLPDRGTAIDGRQNVPQKALLEEEGKMERNNVEKGVPAGGYLIGRHPECGTLSASTVRRDLC